MSAQLPLPARWAEEVADPALRIPEERLDLLARDKRTIARSIRELVEWLVVRQGAHLKMRRSRSMPISTP